MAQTRESTARHLPQEGSLEFDQRLEAVMAAVDLHHLHLQDYLFRLTKHHQDAENLVQDLWHHVLLHFPMEQIGALPILRRKAYQIFVDHYRKVKRRPEQALTPEVQEATANGGGEVSYSETEDAVLKERFWEGYPGIRLSAEQKDVLWLNARYGFTYLEIEERTGTPASTVGDWVALARMRLTDYLNSNPKL